MSDARREVRVQVARALVAVAVEQVERLGVDDVALLGRDEDVVRAPHRGELGVRAAQPVPRRDCRPGPTLLIAARVLAGVSSGLTLTTTSTGRSARGSGRSAAASARPASGHSCLQCESKNSIATVRPRSEASENRWPFWSRSVSIAGAGRAPAAHVAWPSSSGLGVCAGGRRASGRSAAGAMPTRRRATPIRIAPADHGGDQRCRLRPAAPGAADDRHPPPSSARRRRARSAAGPRSPPGPAARRRPAPQADGQRGRGGQACPPVRALRHRTYQIVERDQQAERQQDRQQRAGEEVVGEGNRWHVAVSPPQVVSA